VGDRFKVQGHGQAAVPRPARPLQHPFAEAYFVSLEDEFGFIPLIVWPSVYEEYKRELREPFMMVEGTASRREGTLNIVMQKVTIPKVPNTSVAGNIKLPRPIFRYLGLDGLDKLRPLVLGASSPAAIPDGLPSPRQGRG
jgi:hypothetical protein